MLLSCGDYMNKLQITAIVVTIAIIMPIGLGYLMAVEEVERTGWESTSTANLSDLMLNSDTEYYTVSNLPQNNAEIFVGGTNLKAPVYVSLGSTATSLPEYTVSSSNVTASRSTEYVTGTRSFTPSEDVGAIVCESDGQVRITIGDIDGVYAGDVSITSYGGTVYVNGRSAASGNLSDVMITLVVNPGYTAPVTSYSFVDLPSSGDYTFSSSAYSVARIVADGEAYYVRTQTLSKVVDTVSAGIPAKEYFNVSSIEVVTIGQNSYGAVSVSSVVAGSYGDPAYGWTLPGIDLLSNQDWSNGQENRAVEFYISMADGESFTVSPVVDGDSNSLFVRYEDGQTLINAESPGDPVVTNLGNYPKLHMIVKSDGIEIYGIPEWPPMYSPANDINGYTFDYADMGNFSRVRFVEVGAIEYRVDSATIVAGTFPVAEDFSLDLGQYWPGDSWAIRMPNIGIYGDSITFGGNTYDVEYGRITLVNSDSDIALLDATLSGTYSDGLWTYSINNVEQSTSADLLPIEFNGIWSAAVTGYKMEQVTETILEWIPGEFVLDGSGFVLAALAGIALAFVGLALYGRRSGAKVTWLLVICGAVAFIFISMI